MEYVLRLYVTVVRHESSPIPNSPSVTQNAGQGCGWIRWERFGKDPVIWEIILRDVWGAILRARATVKIQGG